MECTVTFSMILQLWNTNTPVIVSCDADLAEAWFIFQSIWERRFMYFARKFVNLIVPPIYVFSIKGLTQVL